MKAFFEVNEIIDEESKLKNKKVNRKAASFGRNVLCFGKFCLYIRYMYIYGFPCVTYHTFKLCVCMCVCVCVFLQMSWPCINPTKKAKKKSYTNSGIVLLSSCKVSIFLSFFLFFSFLFFSRKHALA